MYLLWYYCRNAYSQSDHEKISDKPQSNGIQKKTNANNTFQKHQSIKDKDWKMLVIEKKIKKIWQLKAKWDSKWKHITEKRSLLENLVTSE